MKNMEEDDVGDYDDDDDFYYNYVYDVKNTLSKELPKDMNESRRSHPAFPLAKVQGDVDDEEDKRTQAWCDGTGAINKIVCLSSGFPQQCRLSGDEFDILCNVGFPSFWSPSK